MNFNSSKHAVWLLVGILCICGCASSTRVSDRISPAEGARVVFVQPSEGSGRDLILALANESEDPEIMKGYNPHNVKELDDKLMAAFVTTLEDKGFFKVASHGRPSHPGPRLIVHLDEGSYHLCLRADRKLYFTVVQIFSAIYSNTQTPIGASHQGGRSPVDFEAQQRRLQRMNAERQRRMGGGRW